MSYGEFEGLDRPKLLARWRDNQETIRGSRGLSEEEYYDEIIKAIERITGPITSHQQFWIAAALSGRGVEWAQTRRGPHYHIVGLPCSICGRR